MIYTKFDILHNTSNTKYNIRGILYKFNRFLIFFLSTTELLTRCTRFLICYIVYLIGYIRYHMYYTSYTASFGIIHILTNQISESLYKCDK